MTRVAILRYPGTWSERDFAHALSLVPGALMRNQDLQYRCDWVHLRVESDRTPFTRGLRGATLRMPIGNGEGCWVADPETRERVEQRGQVVFRYVDGDGGPS